MNHTYVAVFQSKPGAAVRSWVLQGSASLMQVTKDLTNTLPVAAILLAVIEVAPR